MSRPKGMPPDAQPVQRVLDWLIKYAPSACNAKAIGRTLRMPEKHVSSVLEYLEDGKFVVREVSHCFRAVDETDDPVL